MNAPIDGNHHKGLLALDELTGEPFPLTGDAATGSLNTTSGGSAYYQAFNDTTTDTNLVYLGKAAPGSLVSDAVWQVKRYNKSTGKMTFADDVTSFTKQWDARTSYTY